MKSIAHTAIVFLALFVSAVSLEAKTFGGFEVGDSFTLRVSRVTSTKQTGYTGSPITNPIPSGIPRFGRGSLVRFQIGARGVLKAKGISIPLAHFSRTMNEYNLYRPGATLSTTRNAEVTKRNNDATGATLSFFITDNSGAEPVFYTIVYTLR
jgi:hypothetical protein